MVYELNLNKEVKKNRKQLQSGLFCFISSNTRSTTETEHVEILSTITLTSPSSSMVLSLLTANIYQQTPHQKWKKPKLNNNGVRHCLKHFTSTNSFSPQTSSVTQVPRLSPCTVEDNEAYRTSPKSQNYNVVKLSPASRLQSPPLHCAADEGLEEQTWHRH